MTKSSEECPVTVLQKVAVTGAVTITPKIECGTLTVTCLDGKIIKGAHSSSDHKGQSSCRVLLLQELCVEVPVTFTAKAKCDVDQVHCGPAAAVVDDCSSDHSGSSHGDDGSCDASWSGSGSHDDSGSCDDQSGSCDDQSGSGDGDGSGGESGSDCSGDHSGKPRSVKPKKRGD